jgi:hypothetical protein
MAEHHRVSNLKALHFRVDDAYRDEFYRLADERGLTLVGLLRLWGEAWKREQRRMAQAQERHRAAMRPARRKETAAEPAVSHQSGGASVTG